MTTDAISRPHQNSITAASFSQRLMLLMLPVDLFRALPNMVAILGLPLLRVVGQVTGS